MKQCSKCKETKDESDFYKRSGNILQGKCKQCIDSSRKPYVDRCSQEYHNLQGEEKEEVKRRRVKQRRKSELRSKHNMTIEQYEKLYNKQKGKCAICNAQLILYGIQEENKENFACIDHNHDTGVVRGLLCWHCNVILGLAKEDIRTLEQAIRYIKRHKQ